MAEIKGLDKFVSPDMSTNEKNAINRDPATHLATHRGQMIEILHIPSGQIIVFKAYIDDYQDKYDSDWNSTDVYGRMDPIHQFQGTKRVISLDWIVPSYSNAEARFNHGKCAELFAMLYPHYNASGAEFPSSATQISTAPLFKVKLGNLIQDPGYGEGEGTVEDAGLVGAISGFTYAPNVEAGFIDDQGDGSVTGRFNPGFKGQLYPKEVKLSMEFTVFHTNPLGYFQGSKRTPGFPYGGGGASADGSVPASGGSGSNMDELDEAAEAAVTGE